MNANQIKYLQTQLGVEADGQLGPITRTAFANRLIKIALKDIGIVETSKNHGIGIAKFWEATEYPEGYNDRAPYCAAAVSYWISQMRVFSLQDCLRTASAFAVETWGRDKGLNVSKPPTSVKKGSLVVFNFSHVGIATSDSDSKGNFSTVEANTSSGEQGSQRDGGGVYKRTRNISLAKSTVGI